MAKHLKNEHECKCGEIISRQGLRLVYLEDKVKELENKLIEERANRIDDLTAIRYVAESNVNSNKNKQNILAGIAIMTAETLEQITGGIIQNKKEKNFYIDQDT